MSVPILHPREKQALWPQNYDTGRYIVDGVEQYEYEHNGAVKVEVAVTRVDSY